MRTPDADVAAAFEGDALDLVVLVEIQRASSTLRYALNADKLVWSGYDFLPTSGGVEEMKESAEREVPALKLVLQNADGVLGPIVMPGISGGEDLRGRRCILREGSRTLLAGLSPPSQRVFEITLFINGYAWIGREAVAFDLGVFPVEEIRAPNRTCQGIRCWWLRNYKGAHCGYVGDLTTCEGTPADCRRHFPNELLRFGGFVTAADARALTVD